MTFDQIIHNIKKKEYAPIYLIHGEEPFYIDAITREIENGVLNSGEQAFNQSVFYGRDTDFKQVVDSARQFPMMAARRVVIVKEAQDMRTLEKLETYVSNPAPQTILLLAHKHKKVDSRKKLVKTIKKSGLVFESKKIYDNQLPGWIQQYLSVKGFRINPQATTIIAENLGNDLSKISNELDKLVINISKGSQIGPDEVQEHIGISKDYNIFEFQKAIGQKDGEKVFKIIQYFSENQKAHPLPQLIGNLYNFFSKLYMTAFHMKSTDQELQKLLGLPSPYFVRDYKIAAKNLGYNKIKDSFHYLKKADLASKGYGAKNHDSRAILTDFALQVMY